MAATRSSLGEQISEELTCSICLELFTRPKVLPCQHTFCQDCLQVHLGDKKYLKCPNCRQQVKLRRQGVAGLPDNHLVSNLCERLQKQATLSGETREQPQSGNRCSFHPSEEVKLYCKQCCVPVCNECLDEAHSGHVMITQKKALEERRAPVQALVTEGRNILETYCSFLRNLRQKEKSLDEDKQKTDDSIVQAYNQEVQKLAENRDNLLANIDKNHKKIKETLQEERDRVLVDVSELSVACDRAEQEMEQGGVEFLSQETITEVVGKYRGKAAPTPVQSKPAVFQPTDTPVPVLGHVIVPESVLSVSDDDDAEKDTGHHHGNQSQEVQSLPAAPVSVDVEVTHELEGHQQTETVTFGGKGTETGTFFHPTSVAVSDEGEIFIADHYNQRIQVFTLQGTFVRHFLLFGSNGQKMYPHDVALDGEGNLWVVGNTESAEFAVRYTKRGMELRMTVLQKTGWYRGVAVDTKRNHILITQTTRDWGNTQGEVQVFRPDGTLVKTVGRQQGMKYPRCITVGEEGNILVSDSESHCVYSYKEDGQFLFKFGGEGSGEGQLCNPQGICTDKAGNIIVVDSGNHHVEMFDKTGWFLKHITEGMECPWGVETAIEGQLVVTDHAQHTVHVIQSY
ncbi:tripartite motif-containing protein 3-like [Branchiostoma lanceolatum]|uniref:tripartite motif-containing protein 3-like n=1 Tax=Branchiostoma lanceolatum TaxID=7740 RepID=UPI0034571803